ncbi:hypothetical protein JBL43_11325 [Aureibaculum sp. A20]|uniref:WG repeat-containing protein n=1 Tax=Aureibaculum flavum TaxID=2795986 RepID=A0ABS0WSD1_9FLAO|nr:WG repeat-containing protein [Aureibaculum flavum]MBJ2174831.1 hypothetical protein [Aureibaculum flavum]
MKKYNYLLILFIIIVSCNSQDESLQEAKSDLKKSVEIMQSALDFNNEPDIYNPAIIINSKSKNNPQKQLDSLIVKKKIINYLDSIFFTERIDYPGNYLEIDYDKSDFGLIRGDKNYYYQHKDEEPVFLLEKVIYRDKTSQVLADTIEYGAQTNLYKGIVFNTPKPIEQLQVKVIYKYPQVKKVSLRKDKLSIELPEGEIRLKKLENNKVQFIMPISLREKLANVFAYDGDGNAIDVSNYSYSKALTTDQISYLEKVIPIQKMAIEKLNKNEFNSQLELDTYINNNSPADPKDGSTKLIATYIFEEDIAYIDVFFQKGNELYTEHNIIIEKDTYKATHLNFSKATDTTTKKLGFVGLDGNWIKPPVFENLNYQNDYYYTATKNDSLLLLRLNPKENSFDPVNYKLGEYDLYYENLAIIENPNKEQGIINAKTNQMVLPFNYEYIFEDEGLFIARNIDDKYGVYNANMKQVLPEIYDDIEIYDGKISTKIWEDGKLKTDDDFNLKGLKLKK